MCLVIAISFLKSDHYLLSEADCYLLLGVYYYLLLESWLLGWHQLIYISIEHIGLFYH